MRVACTAPRQPPLDARRCIANAEVLLDDFIGCRDSRREGSMEAVAEVRREAPSPLISIACKVPKCVVQL